MQVIVWVDAPFLALLVETTAEGDLVALSKLLSKLTHFSLCRSGQ